MAVPNPLPAGIARVAPGSGMDPVSWPIRPSAAARAGIGCIAGIDPVPPGCDSAAADFTISLFRSDVARIRTRTASATRRMTIP